MQGIDKLYNAFKLSLKAQRRKVAPLQVVSRLEEYLTKDSTLKNLKKQLGRFDLSRYAGYRVDLRGHRNDIYGLVLASYVRRNHEDDDHGVFVRKVKECGRKHRLRYWDLSGPLLDLVYANEPVTILRGEFNASLYAGLWRSAD